VQLYSLCELLSEGLIYSMVVFSPWAFGTTQPWSIWAMNIGGYLLGLMYAFKLSIRRVKGYPIERWGMLAAKSYANQTDAALRTAHRMIFALAVLTLAILAYCFASALNGAATYEAETLSFLYHDHLSWLPHSLDTNRTWASFWSLLALGCSFWAI